MQGKYIHLIDFSDVDYDENGRFTISCDVSFGVVNRTYTDANGKTCFEFLVTGEVGLVPGLDALPYCPRFVLPGEKLELKPLSYQMPPFGFLLMVATETSTRPNVEFSFLVEPTPDGGTDGVPAPAPDGVPAIPESGD